MDWTCPDGSEAPDAATEVAAWDSTTLAGKAQVTDKFPVCGNSEPESIDYNIILKPAS
jgi:hypothetical protein